MVRENKGSTVKEELEIILEDENQDLDFGFPVSSLDGNTTKRAFSYSEEFFEKYESLNPSFYHLNY